MKSVKHHFLSFIIPVTILFPTLLGDAILWDDLYLTASWQESSLLQIEYFTRLGMPWQGWLHYALHQLPHSIFIYKLMSVLSYGIASLFIYKLLCVTESLKKRDCFNITLLASFFPCYNLWFSVIQMPQPLYIALFFSGCYYYYNGVKTKDKLSTTIGLVIIFPTFALQSLYMFIYGLLFIWFWQSKSLETNLIKSAIKFVKKHAGIISMPLLQFITIKTLLSIQTPFNGYNQIQFERLPINIIASFVLPPFNIILETWHSLTEDLTLLAFLITVSTLVFFIAKKKLHTNTKYPALVWKTLLYAGIILALFSIFPYALVNKPYTGKWYTGRFSMLLSLPISFIIYSSLQLILREKAKLRTGIIAIILTMFFLVSVKDQILWQTRYIKYLSISHQLEGFEPEIEPLVFFQDNTSIGKPAPFIYFELNWIMSRAWNNRDHFGFSSFFGQENPVLLFNELEQRHYYKTLSDSFFQRLMLFSKNSNPVGTNTASLVLIQDATFDSNLSLWFNWILPNKGNRVDMLENLVTLRICEVNKP